MSKSGTGYLLLIREEGTGHVVNLSVLCSSLSPIRLTQSVSPTGCSMTSQQWQRPWWAARVSPVPLSGMKLDLLYSLLKKHL